MRTKTERRPEAGAQAPEETDRGLGDPLGNGEGVNSEGDITEFSFQKTVLGLGVENQLEEPEVVWGDQSGGCTAVREAVMVLQMEQVGGGGDFQEEPYL